VVPPGDGVEPTNPPPRTQVAIVGAGPAGLVLSLLLHADGIECVVLEMHDREYVEHRVRAGVLEQTTVDLLCEAGVGDRLQRDGLVHHGIGMRFGGRAHRVDFEALTGRAITIYGQQEVVKDLLAARAEAVAFGATAIGVDAAEPSVRYELQGREHTLHADFVAGCDGFHGPARAAVPGTDFEHVYPIGWLGVLAEVAPSVDEVTYCHHERGFALHSMRSASISRLYLQCAPDEDLDRWPDDRIWDELRRRMEIPGWTLRDGPIVERNVVGMHSFVHEPMQHGRVFLAGDAAHIVPATGAKGMNLAIADARILAGALAHWYRTGDDERLRGYTAACLPRVWRAERFASWMTNTLHPDGDPFRFRVQLAELDYVFSSTAAATALAENYVGLRE
jgi:p-hydroxybenzoate 3-monooxygenase